MKKLGLIFLFIYFVPGLFVGFVEFEKSLRIFECPTAAEPHYGFSQESYKNPDPEKCYRQAFTRSGLISFFTLSIVGTPLIIVKSF